VKQPISALVISDDLPTVVDPGGFRERRIREVERRVPRLEKTWQDGRSRRTYRGMRGVEKAPEELEFASQRRDGIENSLAP
jgi:hypothetical protein